MIKQINGDYVTVGKKDDGGVIITTRRPDTSLFLTEDEWLNLVEMVFCLRAAKDFWRD